VIAPRNGGKIVSELGANLVFRIAGRHHILEEPFKDTFNFEKECCSIALFRVDVASKTVLSNLVPSSAGECIKDIKTRHLCRYR
jgi:hypothetical protein